ncbi:MAG: hypothetical protein KC543_15440 [Myxococcales bacterium]|nr:hypothetical protein [Myxococcales bacterium]
MPELDRPPFEALVAPQGGGVAFSTERLRWLVQLRWVAMVGVALASVLAAVGFYPGAAWPLMAGTAAVGSLYNWRLTRRSARGELGRGRRAGVSQIFVDLALLTVVLWANGGVRCPFVALYVLHVAISAMLGGPAVTVLATAAAFLGVGLLGLTDVFPVLAIGAWGPHRPWDVVAEVAAFALTLGSVAYVVNHAASELRDRERELRVARERAVTEYRFFESTLEELAAGLEVLAVGDDGCAVQWRNRLVEQLTEPERGLLWRCPAGRCERDESGECPVERARRGVGGGRCRFAATVGGEDRVYEVLSFPLGASGSRPPAGTDRLVNIYVDRTQATLAERRLLLAERLASLGRIAQGVAHELNTPLATIRTLATDMRDVLEELDHAPPDRREGLLADVAESAHIIRDETHRLGRITQALLAGGDLSRARARDHVALREVVERATALVFAGIRGGAITAHLDPSLDDCFVRADPDRLMQVLVNLLQNAVDALRTDGGSRVTVSAATDGGRVALVVDDDGVGLAPEVAGRLFEPFATTKPPGEGTGLGLYTSYMLVQAMGGDLTIEPGPTGGVRASVRLVASAPGAPSAGWSGGEAGAGPGAHRSRGAVG